MSGDCRGFALYPKSIWHIFRMKRWMESRHNMLFKALTMHVSCLFVKPEAVSKHSVSLWIGYSEYDCLVLDCNIKSTCDVTLLC